MIIILTVLLPVHCLFCVALIDEWNVFSKQANDVQNIFKVSNEDTRTMSTDFSLMSLLLTRNTFCITFNTLIQEFRLFL